MNNCILGRSSLDQLFGQWRKRLHWSDGPKKGNINKKVSAESSVLNEESRLHTTTVNYHNPKVCNSLNQLVTQIKKWTEEDETLKRYMHQQNYTSETEGHHNTSE